MVKCCLSWIQPFVVNAGVLGTYEFDTSLFNLWLQAFAFSSTTFIGNSNLSTKVIRHQSRGWLYIDIKDYAKTYLQCYWYEWTLVMRYKHSKWLQPRQQPHLPSPAIHECFYSSNVRFHHTNHSHNKYGTTISIQFWSSLVASQNRNTSSVWHFRQHCKLRLPSEKVFDHISQLLAVPSDLTVWHDRCRGLGYRSANSVMWQRYG